jgi:hypothetical protein
MKFYQLGFLLFLGVQGCALRNGAAWHDTTAQEHDLNVQITNAVRNSPEIRPIIERHNKIHGNNYDLFLWIVTNGNKELSAELGREEKPDSDKMTTPFATRQDIETFWNVLNREARAAGFQGSIALDVYPNSKKERYFSGPAISDPSNAR